MPNFIGIIGKVLRTGIGTRVDSGIKDGSKSTGDSPSFLLLIVALNVYSLLSEAFFCREPEIHQQIPGVSSLCGPTFLPLKYLYYP